MGMYDYVNFQTPCPKCGTKLVGFQTKDRVCEMATFEPEDVDDFYTSCDKCKTWVEFYRQRPPSSARAVPLTEEQVLALGFTKEVREK